MPTLPPRSELAETALAIAREKADDQGIEVEFAAADAFQLKRLGRRFHTVLDCGLFYVESGVHPKPTTEPCGSSSTSSAASRSNARRRHGRGVKLGHS
jgi:hypothetical protein